jgi:chorismate mutase
MAEERAVDDGRGPADKEVVPGAGDPPAAPEAAEQPAADPAAAAERPEILARVDALRRRIDDLDEQLVRLLSARAACALQVGREKKLLGLEIYQPSRETEVLAHVQRINPGPLNDAAVKRLFERIIDEARRLERESDGGED